MSTIINADTSDGLKFTSDTSGEIKLQSAGTDIVSVTANGMAVDTNTLYVDATNNRVGIGTSSPTTKLQVVGTSGSLNARVNAGNTGLDITSNDATGITDLATSPLGAGGKAMTFTTYTGSSSAERMRIDSSGNVGIGMTTPGAKLGVTASATGVKVIRALTYRGVSCENGAPTGETTDGAFYSYTGNAASTAFNHYAAQCGGSVVFKVLGNGNVQNTNNSYGAISDVKLKENIVDTTPKLSQLNQVRVVNYNFIGDAQKQIGVVAQELESIFPSMVEEIPERDEEGNDIGTTAKSVKYSVFVPILIKAIQEQQETIKALETRIQALENA